MRELPIELLPLSSYRTGKLEDAKVKLSWDHGTAHRLAFVLIALASTSGIHSAPGTDLLISQLLTSPCSEVVLNPMCARIETSGEGERKEKAWMESNHCLVWPLSLITSRIPNFNEQPRKKGRVLIESVEVRGRNARMWNRTHGDSFVNG